MSWQPIETAPRDINIRVDLWAAERERYKNSRITDCYFRDGQWWHPATIYDDEEWIEKFGGDAPVYNATHWMPLPPVPDLLAERPSTDKKGP